MPQHNLDIANGSGVAVRAAINSALDALGSTMKGPNAPPAPRAGMLWVEDDNPSSSRWTLRIYDGADWIVLGIIDSTTNIFEPAGFVPSAWIDVASASAVDLGAANSQNLRITGTTTITGFGTAASGTRRQLRFAGALTLTHNATSLILPGGSSIITAAGDTALAVSLGGGNWVVVQYDSASGDVVARAGVLRAQGAGAPTTGEVALGNGAARLRYDGSEFDLNGPLRVNGGRVGINLGAPVSATGTAVDFTGIPAGVRRVTVMVNGLSTGGTSPPILQLGTSGGIVASGYDAVGTGYGGTITSAEYPTGFGLTDSNVASNTFSGVYVLNLSGSDVWTMMGMARRSAAVGTLATGSVDLPAALDRLRLTTVGGTDAFDAGTVAISWEF